jgi:hypothetical protein
MPNIVELITCRTDIGAALFRRVTVLPGFDFCIVLSRTLFHG